MEACEPGQGLTAAAISSRLFVRWASHRQSLNHTAGAPVELGSWNPRQMRFPFSSKSVSAMADSAAYQVVARRYRQRLLIY